MISNFFSLETPEALLQRQDVLAVIPSQSPINTYVGNIDAHLKALGPALNEVWIVKKATVTRFMEKQTYCAKTSELLFASITINKVSYESDLEKACQSAYSELINFINRQGYEHPYRFWNYIAHINSGDGDDENYKRFCTGRLSAFTHAGITPEAFPAASALGHFQSGAVIYVIAGKEPAQHFDNKKQVNAYEYPRQYGISSPSFARATLYNQGKNLFISGTASIIGYETISSGDIHGQLDVTAQNIECLLESIGRKKLSLSTLKVYIRHPDDYDIVVTFLTGRFPGTSLLILHADICRSELLVEVECFAC